ncbi:MAG: glycosyltransferase family 4 protein [Calditrichia bacterium]
MNSSAVYGGTEKWAVTAARLLKARGHRVYFAYRYPVMREYAENEGLETIRFPLQNDADIYSIIKLMKTFSRLDLQAVVSTKVKEYWLGTVAAKLSGRKSILRLGINRSVKNKWKNRKIYGAWADGIVVNAEAIADTLASTGFIPRQKISLIYNGVACPDALPEFRTSPDPFIYIYVGSLIPRKNVDVLIQNFSELIRLTPGKPLKLRIAGDGHERARLERLVRELGLENSVQFMGHRKDVPQLLQQAHGFVLLSENEGFPNAALEAMARGVPVIMSRVAGAEEIIGSGDNGLLVNTGGEGEVLKAMQMLLHDPELRLRIRNRAFQKVKIELTYQAMAEKLEDVLYGIING